ncbi:MAG: EutP/PduV family microcompartment system protein [Desulfobacterales bacterium]|nr:EutP/PduV family microcompartment system protein [Desulfobacterales bacterium]
MRKRMVIMGAGGCGKTSLAHVLSRYQGPLKRTQDMIFKGPTLDVPGAYLEIPWMYRNLISAVQNHGNCVLMLVDQTAPSSLGAPGFAQVFSCPVFGVVTKVDEKPENQGRCHRELERLGVSRPYFEISTRTGEGMDGLESQLQEFMEDR